MPTWFKIFMLAFGAVLAYIAFNRFLAPVRKFASGAWSLVSRGWK